ncbi:MAG: tRNA preQ1(34) S-adenosylmethionine ribosyltransferase-isomerase QueA [Gemmatimonadaceae bacterium]|nr:tRNA preQ1(34) S-adenosylmethionine ribosyltransferase-isomerase QueA [Gemmatimonadaceae bacterium]
MLRTSDYDFALSEALIAQTAVEPRDAARLMHVDRATGTITHRTFRDLDQLLSPGDTLVVNTTTVLKARLLGTRDSGAPAEVLLLRPLGDGTWEAMVQPGAKLKPGRHVHLADRVSVEIVAVLPDSGTRRVRLHAPMSDTEMIETYGHVPLPPYIDRADTPADAARYQTVYRDPQAAGSVAAPTAGLHFTPALLERIAAKGVQRTDILLHVGAGTFRPVSVDDPSAHVMHEEWYQVSPAAATRLNAVRAAGGRVCAVGTTSVRTLSTCYRDGRYHAGEGGTSIFLHPPMSVPAIDMLVTNFHLPKSTLVMLVAAVAGYELTMHAYRTAVAEGYRFYSYGDAMVIT